MHQNIKNEIQKNIEKLQLQAEKLLKSNQSNMFLLWSEYSNNLDTLKGKLIAFDEENEYENLFYIYLIIDQQYKINVENFNLIKEPALMFEKNSENLTKELKQKYILNSNIKV